jgi:hypothetical protein
VKSPEPREAGESLLKNSNVQQMEGCRPLRGLNAFFNPKPGACAPGFMQTPASQVKSKIPASQVKAKTPASQVKSL